MLRDTVWGVNTTKLSLALLVNCEELWVWQGRLARSTVKHGGMKRPSIAPTNSLESIKLAGASNCGWKRWQKSQCRWDFFDKKIQSQQEKLMQAKLVQLHHYQEELRMEDIVPSRHKVLCTVPKTHYSSQTDQVDSLLYTCRLNWSQNTENRDPEI